MDTRKRLFGPAQLTNSTATKYTTPAGTKTVVKHIRVANPTGGAVTFTLGIGADAAGTRLYDAVSIPAGGSIEAFCMYVLEAAEIIAAHASAATSLVLTIDGVENTLG
jgi:hypothetical protein